MICLPSNRGTGCCGQAVDGPVLSGTPKPVPSGTRFPCYQERERAISFGIHRGIPAPSNIPNIESFGFFLTHPSKSPAVEHVGEAP
jgi:hypothetical protein